MNSNYLTSNRGYQTTQKSEPLISNTFNDGILSEVEAMFVVMIVFGIAIFVLWVASMIATISTNMRLGKFLDEYMHNNNKAPSVDKTVELKDIKNEKTDQKAELIEGIMKSRFAVRRSTIILLSVLAALTLIAIIVMNIAVR